MTLREEIEGLDRYQQHRLHADGEYVLRAEVLAIFDRYTDEAIDRYYAPTEAQIQAHEARCLDPEHCVDDPPAPHEAWRGCFENAKREPFAKREPLPSEERSERDRLRTMNYEGTPNMAQMVLTLVEAIDANTAAIREAKR